MKKQCKNENTILMKSITTTFIFSPESKFGRKQSDYLRFQFLWAMRVKIEVLMVSYFVATELIYTLVLQYRKWKIKMIIPADVGERDDVMYHPVMALSEKMGNTSALRNETKCYPLSFLFRYREPCLFHNYKLIILTTVCIIWTTYSKIIWIPKRPTYICLMCNADACLKSADYSASDSVYMLKAMPTVPANPKVYSCTAWQDTQALIWHGEQIW